MTAVGKLIREARLRNKFSQQDVASALGLTSDAQISRIERGAERIAYRRLRGVAQKLCIPYKDLQEAWVADEEQRLDDLEGWP